MALRQLGETQDHRRFGTLGKAAAQLHHDPFLTQQESESGHVAAARPQRCISHLLSRNRSWQIAEQLPVLRLSGFRANRPHPQADIVGFGLVAGLEVSAVIDVAGGSVNQLAQLEFPRVSSHAAHLVLGQKRRNVEQDRRANPGLFRQVLGGGSGRGAVELQPGWLHLPGCRRPDGGTATHENQVPVVGHGGLPFFQASAVCTLGEVVARLAGRKTAIAAPCHVAPPVDDEGKSSQANTLSPRQFCRDAQPIAAIRTGFGDGL